MLVGFITRRIKGLEVILRRIMDWVVTLYPLSANRSKNTLYGVLRGCHRLSVVYQVIFLLITRLVEVSDWRYIVTVV